MDITITIKSTDNLSVEILEALASQARWVNKEGKSYTARSMSDEHIWGVLRGLEGYYKPLLEPVMPLDLWAQVFKFVLNDREAKESASRKECLEKEFLKLDNQFYKEQIEWGDFKARLERNLATVESVIKAAAELGKPTQVYKKERGNLIIALECF